MEFKTCTVGDTSVLSQDIPDACRKTLWTDQRASGNDWTSLAEERASRGARFSGE